MHAQATGHRLTEMESAPRPQLDTTELHLSKGTLTKDRCPSRLSVFMKLHSLYWFSGTFLFFNVH